jgi:hypothetical protein
MSGKSKGINIKGYYQRARVFGYLLIAALICYAIYYVYQLFID